MIRLQGLTEIIHPSGRAIFIAGKNCGLFRGNCAWPCSITMPANFAPEKSYTPSDGGDNVTSENHHGGFPYQFLSRHVERQIQRLSKEGSPSGVSLLTYEKAPERFLRIRGIIFLIDVDALFLRQCLCCLLPNVGAFIRSDIYLASFRNVECLIEVRHRAKSASGAGFVWRMHVFFDL